MSSNNVIVEIKNLSLTYPLNFYEHNSSLKDIFINAIQSPFDFFLEAQQYFTALSKINFTIQENDIVGILGRNGSGKTTLCKCIAGLLTPSSGEIIKNGSIQSIFDTSISILPNLTGRENAFLLAKLYFKHLDQHELNIIVQDALEFSELGNFLDVPYKNYSRGMQARLCLSVISSRPSNLLILDEVLEGADQFFRRKINKRMQKIIQQSSSVLLVSHSIEHIYQICNKVIILDKGKIIFNGSTKKGCAIYSI